MSIIALELTAWLSLDRRGITRYRVMHCCFGAATQLIVMAPRSRVTARLIKAHGQPEITAQGNCEACQQREAKKPRKGDLQ
jgi:hypothetical protein